MTHSISRSINPSLTAIARDVVAQATITGTKISIFLFSPTSVLLSSIFIHCPPYSRKIARAERRTPIMLKITRKTRPKVRQRTF